MKSKKEFSEYISVDANDVKYSSGILYKLFEKNVKKTHETLKYALWHRKNSATFKNFITASKLKNERKKNGFEEKYEFSGGTSDWIPKKGKIKEIHQGTSWSDGDCYKYMEGLSRIYANTTDNLIKDELRSTILRKAALLTKSDKKKK